MEEGEAPKRRSEKPVPETLLKLRRRIKAKTPAFIRQESWRYKRIKSPWRKPKGIDSKMRLHRKGWPASPKVGYRLPKAIRGLHPTGFYEAIVHNLAGLEGLDPKRFVLRISGKVGRNKRLAIVEEARRRGFHVLNPGEMPERPEGEAGTVAKAEAKAEAEESREEEET